MTLTVVTYLAYVLVALPFTVWVGTTLSRSGRQRALRAVGQAPVASGPLAPFAPPVTVAPPR